MALLILLRHAKSSWDDPDLADFDRPLAPRGRRAAKRIGQLLADEGLIPDRILCSTAVRARETLDLVLPHLREHGRPEVVFTDDLYHASGGDYLGAIAASGGAASSLMLVGHNPAMQATAVELVGGGEGGLASELAAKFPTAAAAILEFDLSSWRGIAPGTGRLTAFLRPRDG